MAANHLFFKLTFLSIVLLPIVVSAAFPLEKTETLSKLRAVNAEGPYYGLIISSNRVAQEFLDAADFRNSKDGPPYVDLAGRRFWIGSVEKKNIIFVISEGGLVNAVATTHLLLNNFNVYGVVNFGTSGSTNNSLKIGDVVVPDQFVHTGLWDWVNPNADIASDNIASLDVKDYNVPEGGSNSLGRIGYRSGKFYSETGQPGNGVEKVWFEVNDTYVRIASELQDVKAKYKMPNIVTGVKGSTSDIYVANAAYREFLYQSFQVSSVDTESSAIVQTCLSIGNPRVIVFRGLSNLAGAATPRTLQATTNAARNVARVVVQFIKALPNVLQHAKA